MHDRWNNSTLKLVSGLALLTVGAVLMCLDNRNLFFIGLALVVSSGLFSQRAGTSVGWPVRIISWLARFGAIMFFLWLSSSGREPLSWAGACAGVFAVGITQFGYWCSNRRRAANA